AGRDATSTAAARASDPAAATSDSTWRSGASSTSANATAIPSDANRKAIARPIPLAAPVTTATFPAKFCTSTPRPRLFERRTTYHRGGELVVRAGLREERHWRDRVATMRTRRGYGCIATVSIASARIPDAARSPV